MSYRDSSDNHPEKLNVLNGLIDVEDHSRVVDLHNLVTQHLFILVELYFHCQTILSQQNNAQLIDLNSTNLRLQFTAPKPLSGACAAI